MLLDGRSLPAATRLQTQVCIVGTGMGALSVARGLIEAGIDLILVEAGPVEAKRGELPAVAIENIGRPFRLATSRGLEVGGGTEFWHGVCAPLDEIDFQRRDWIAHSGWPISAGTLAENYRQAWDFLCGGDRSAMPPAVAGLDEAPAAADLMQTKVYQYRTPPFRGKEMVRGWCAKGQARCIAHATALELVSDHDGTARQLVVGSGEHTFAVRAQVFIVAAGALETPRLLLNSRARMAVAPGKDTWWLGRNLIDHPAAYLSQVVFRQRIAGRLLSGNDVGDGIRAMPGFMFKPQVQSERGLPNHTVFIRPGINGRKLPNHLLMSFLGVRGIRDLRAVHLKALLSDSYIRWRVAHQRLQFNWPTRYGDLFFMTEQLPNPESRVDLSEKQKDRYGYPVARVNWQLSGDDLERFQTSVDLIMASFDRHPAIRSTRKDDVDDWLAAVCSAAHHLGTARMAASPADGVVDADLKVFGTKNVWVCDGSVFPTAGSVNPSLTISALGHRLADHLLAGALNSAPAIEVAL